jgi:hypothetical protein
MRPTVAECLEHARQCKWYAARTNDDFHAEIGTDQQWRAFRRLTEARTATLGQATRALHNYLTTGYPHWRDVLAA